MAIDTLTGLEKAPQGQAPNFVVVPPSPYSQLPDYPAPYPGSVVRNDQGKITAISYLFDGQSSQDGILYKTTFDFDKQEPVTVAIGTDPLPKPPKLVESFIPNPPVQVIPNSQPIVSHLSSPVTVIANSHLDSIQTFQKSQLPDVQDDPSSLFYLGKIKADNLKGATIKAFADKNLIKKGDQSLLSDEGIFFKFGAKTYLAINDNRSKFNPGSDIIANISGATLSDRQIGKLKVGNYF